MFRSRRHRRDVRKLTGFAAWQDGGRILGINHTEFTIGKRDPGRARGREALTAQVTVYARPGAALRCGIASSRLPSYAAGSNCSGADENTSTSAYARI